jgi:hypothetical protein
MAPVDSDRAPTPQTADGDALDELRKLIVGPEQAQFRRWQERLDKAEVALLHTLRYRGERGFLIYGDSGLLLLQVEAKAVTPQDGDLNSGMLTVI